jgi:hypothetical protein
LRIRDVISDPDPDFYHPRSRISNPRSLIPDPKATTAKEKGGKYFGHTFVCTHKFHKIVNYFIFKQVPYGTENKFLPKKLSLFLSGYRKNFVPKKLSFKLSEIWVGDPGSGKNLSWIQGSRKHRVPDPGNTGIVTHWRFLFGLARRENTDTTTVDFRFRCRSSAESRQAASQTILGRVSSPLSWLQVCTVHLISFILISWIRFLIVLCL